MLLHGLQETDAGSQVFRLRLFGLHGHGDLVNDGALAFDALPVVVDLAQTGVLQRRVAVKMVGEIGRASCRERV